MITDLQAPPPLRGALSGPGAGADRCRALRLRVTLNTRYFRYNAYDAISRTAFQSILGDAQSRGLTSAPGSVRIGGTWWYEPEMNFYRRRHKTDWLSVYDVKSPRLRFPGAEFADSSKLQLFPVHARRPAVRFGRRRAVCRRAAPRPVFRSRDAPHGVCGHDPRPPHE